MQIAVIGASGNVGTRIVDEALNRGHHVTAIGRDISKVIPRDRLTAAAGDVTEPHNLAKAIAGHDVVVSSVTFVETVPAILLDAVRSSGVSRYLSVGGAGSLWASPGVLFVDTPGFPQEVLDESHHGRALLAALQNEQVLNWTMLTPAAVFEPGERTGKFRLGADALVVHDDGTSRISYEDYAVALIDEIERPQNTRRRFTIGY